MPIYDSRKTLNLNNMIKKLEQLRQQRKPFLGKRELARQVGISVAMYYRYVKKNDAPYSVVEKIVNALGYDLTITISL